MWNKRRKRCGRLPAMIAAGIALFLTFPHAVHGTGNSKTQSGPTAPFSDKELIPDETIDAYAARKLLDSEAPPGASTSGIELIYIQGDKQRRTAYVLIDGKYGKEVSVGQNVQGWMVKRVDADSVELRRGHRRDLLLLGSDSVISPFPRLPGKNPLPSGF